MILALHNPARNAAAELPAGGRRPCGARVQGPHLPKWNEPRWSSKPPRSSSQLAAPASAELGASVTSPCRSSSPGRQRVRYLGEAREFDDLGVIRARHVMAFGV